MTRMTDAARHVLHRVLMSDPGALAYDLPLDGWEHYSTSIGDDGASVFCYDRADGRSIVVNVHGEGVELDRDRSLLEIAPDYADLENGPSADDGDFGEELGEEVFEVVLGNGDRAQADSLHGIMAAAARLVEEAADFYGGAKRARATLVITEAGQYDAGLTSLAREGYRPAGGN